MNIEKAIEILTHYLGKDSRCYDPDLYDSVKLGIEALKRLQQLRTSRITWFRGLLTGETDDSSQEAEEINPEPTNP